MRALFDNRKKDTSGQLLTMGRSGSSISNTLCRGPDKNGWAENSDRMPYVEYAESAVPSSRRMNQGLAFTPDGALYITGDAVTSTSNKVNGIAIRADGALHVAPAGSTATLKSNGMGITASGQVIMAESFVSPLNNSVVPLIGTGSATFTRATVATVSDHEGVLRSCLSGEVRFQGARRVQNRLLATEAITGASWAAQLTGSATAGATDPLGGTTATQLDFPVSGDGWKQTGATVPAGSSTVSVWLRGDVAGTIRINSNSGTQLPGTDLSITTTWARYSTGVGTGAADAQWWIRRFDAGQLSRVYIWRPQWESVTGQSIQTPGEYVSVGVLSSPYHGAMVDGVKYFATTNGNTVASNVVTEATGSPISASTLVGYLAEAAGTQLVTPTASIRDMTNAAWVKGATMTAALTGTGIDGVANSCSRLTGGAVAATNTAFQTLVAAATSRTYSCYIKRVTGTGVINITQNGGTGYTDITSQINSSTFTKVSLNASILNAAFGIQIVTSGDVILVDFNQFEAGTFATSPMASAGAARNADVLTYPSAGNISGTVGSVYCEAALNSLFDYNTLIAGSTGSRYLMSINSVGSMFSYDGTTAPSQVFGISANSSKKFGISWGSGRTYAYNGSTAAKAFDGDFDIGPALNIGFEAAGLNIMFGTIRNVRIYSTQLSASQLQAVTV
jgi:hypothetical protein